MAKMKVSELPKEEQQALISEANALGLRGVLTTWGVETLKAKIEELKNAQTGAEQSGESTTAEVPAENTENQEAEQETQPEENSIPEGVSDEAKAFLNGESDELPSDAEEITDKEAEQLQTTDAPAPVNENEPKLPPVENKKVENKKSQICHICRSKVINGKCTGCGFEFTK